MKIGLTFYLVWCWSMPEKIRFLHKKEEVGVYDKLISETIWIYIDGKIVGHVKFSVLESRNEVWISELVVDGNYRRRGYGTKLLEKVKAVGVRVKLPVRLGAHPDVIEFYEKCGFLATQLGSKDSPLTIMEWS